MTRMPASGPLLPVSVSTISTPLEFGFDLVEESLISRAKVFGAKARETVVTFLGCKRRRVHRALDELLVPTRDQGRSLGNPLRCCKRFGGDLIVGYDPRDETFLKCLLRPENAPFQQDLQCDGRTRELHERIEFRMRHHKTKVLDRHAKAAGFPADAQVAHGGNLKSATHADAMNHRDNRMPARTQRLQRAMHDRPISTGLFDIGAIGPELGY